MTYKLSYNPKNRLFHLMKWNFHAQTWIRTTHYTGSKFFAGVMAVEANRRPEKV